MPVRPSEKTPCFSTCSLYALHASTILRQPAFAGLLPQLLLQSRFQNA